MSSFDEWWKEYDHHGRSLKYSVASDAWNAALDAAAKVARDTMAHETEFMHYNMGHDSAYQAKIAAAIERLKEVE
jgi:hypothetical protein